MRFHISAWMAKNFLFGDDKPLSYTQVRRMCSCIKWDLEFEENITPIRFRTTVLTDVYEQTGDINLAQKEAGHTTPAMTLKYYDVKGRKTSGDAAIAIERVYTASRLPVRKAKTRNPLCCNGLRVFQLPKSWSFSWKNADFQ